MSNPNFSAERYLPAAATATFLGVLALCVSADVPLPDRGAEHSLQPAVRPLPVLSQQPSIPDSRIRVYPVTVNASGFGRAEYRQDFLRNAATNGWRRLSAATNGALSSNVEVTVMPVSTVGLPGVREMPNICNPQARSDFRAKLIAAVAPKPAKKEIPVIVVEQPGKPNCHILADGGLGMGVIVYDGDSADEGTYMHEFGHTIGLGHDSALLCDPAFSMRVGKACKIVEYGNVFTVMGAGGTHNLHDIDPLTAFALQRLNALKRGQVVTVKSTETKRVRLSAIQNADGEGKPSVKAVRIPLAGSGNPVNLACMEKADNPEDRTCVKSTSIYIELSGGDAVDDGGRQAYPVTVKAYAVNEQGDMQNTYLLPLGPVHALGQNRVGDTVKMQVGNSTIRLRLRRLQQYSPADSTGVADISVSVTPDVPAAG